MRRTSNSRDDCKRCASDSIKLEVSRFVFLFFDQSLITPRIDAELNRPAPPSTLSFGRIAKPIKGGGGDTAAVSPSKYVVLILANRHR